MNSPASFAAADVRPAAERLATTARRHKYRIVAAAVVAALISAIVAALQPPLYQAQTSLFVRFGREYLYRSEVGENESWAPNGLESAVNSEVQILSARELRAKVIEAIGVETLYPDMGKSGNSPIAGIKTWLIGQLPVLSPDRPQSGASEPTLLDRAQKRFQDNLVIAAVPQSNVIVVFFRHPNRELAQRALEVLTQFFISRRLEIYGSAEPAVVEEQFALYQRRLADAEKALVDFQRESHLAGDADATLYGRAAQLQDVRDRSADQAKQLEAQISIAEATMRRLLANDAAFSSADPEPIRRDEAKLADLQHQLATLSGSVAKDSALVAALERERDLAKQSLIEARQGMAVGLPSNYQALFQPIAEERYRLLERLSEIRAALEMTDRQLAALRQVIDAADQRRLTQMALERRVDAEKQDYEIYLRKLGVKRESDALDRQRLTNLRVIEAPNVALEPIGIPRSAKVIIGALLGALVALGLGLLADTRRAAGRRPVDQLPASSKLADAVRARNR